MNQRNCDTALPPRTSSAPHIHPVGDALIVGAPGDWRITSKRDLAAEIIGEWSPELGPAYDAAIAIGNTWHHADVALLALAVNARNAVSL